MAVGITEEVTHSEVAGAAVSPTMSGRSYEQLVSQARYLPRQLNGLHLEKNV